jgi:hypothetical protein
VLPDGGFYQGLSVLNDQTLATIADIPLPGTFDVYQLIALPGLHKVYFGYGSPVVVTTMDETSYAMTPVTLLQGQFDEIDALAYDPVRQLAYVVGGQTPWYVEVVDAAGDQLVATLFLDAGSTDCSMTSISSCLESPYQAAVDVTGQELYLGGNDQFGAPMAATVAFSGVDGGSLQNPVGGQAAGWYAEAFGLVTFDDGGAMAGVWLGEDAGGGAVSLTGGFEILDPSLDPAPILPYAMATVEGDFVCDKKNLSVNTYTTEFGNLALDIVWPGIGGVPEEDEGWTVPNGTVCAGMTITSLVADMQVVSTQPFKACLGVTVVCQPDPNPDGGSTPSGVVASVRTGYCCPPN